MTLRLSAREHAALTGGTVEKRSKYGAVKTTVDGIRFDSRLEARRWCELKLLERAGKIADLRRQVAFPLIVCDEKIGTYVADFVYDKIGRLGVRTTVVEDPKGYRTALFKWKLKHVRAQYGIDIQEV